MSTYAKQLATHLAVYKNKRLGPLEPGAYMHRGEQLFYEHVLPKEQQWLNLLAPFRVGILRYLSEHPAIKLHRDFHHLNSSQAFALNLFVPYFEMGGATQLLGAMGSSGPLSSWEAEHVADPDEGTNVDVTWLSGGVRTYCEVKLSERKFGAASDDNAHREKLERIYKPVLSGACAPEMLLPQSFFPHYQLFRNLWVVAREPKSQLVFLLPKANTKVWQQVAAFQAKLSGRVATKVRVVSIEDVIEYLALAKNLPSVLSNYAELLKEKYVLPAAA